MRLLFGLPSIVADFNLLEEDISRKGVAEGDLRPVKAIVLRVAAVQLPPSLHKPPSTLGQCGSGTYSG